MPKVKVNDLLLCSCPVRRLHPVFAIRKAEVLEGSKDITEIGTVAGCAEAK